VNSTEQKSNNFIVRRPLLAYFVLSYTFFWGFLVLIMVILGMLRLQPDALPTWAMPLIVILGSWMPNLAAVTVTGVLAGREGIRQLLGKFFAYRIAVRWYLVALLPFPLAFIAAGLYRLAGGAAPGNTGLSAGFWAGLIILSCKVQQVKKLAGGVLLSRVSKKPMGRLRQVWFWGCYGISGICPSGSSVVYPVLTYWFMFSPLA